MASLRERLTVAEFEPSEPFELTTRRVPCPECGGDGGFSYPVGLNSRTGELIERVQPCVACEATGEVEIEVEPITMEDLA